MCKAWSDAQKDAERNGVILGTIDAWREAGISDAEIKNKIISKYNLTEEEATEFMLKKREYSIESGGDRCVQGMG